MENNTEELMWRKCMDLAKQYAKEWSEAFVRKKKRCFRHNEFYIISNPWVELWKGYEKGKVTEEEVKYCFNLGFVPEYIL